MEELMETKVEEPVIESEVIEETPEIEESEAEIVENTTSDVENASDNGESTDKVDENDFNTKPYIKVATARLLGPDGVTLYRFDITHKDVDENNGVIELRNIVNNLDAIRPDTEKGYKNYFMLIGIIAFNFPTVVMSYNQNILATITQLESLINQHLHIAGFKENEFRFRIDTVIED